MHDATAATDVCTSREQRGTGARLVPTRHHAMLPRANDQKTSRTNSKRREHLQQRKLPHTAGRRQRQLRDGRSLCGILLYAICSASLTAAESACCHVRRGGLLAHGENAGHTPQIYWNAIKARRVMAKALHATARSASHAPRHASYASRRHSKWKQLLSQHVYRKVKHKTCIRGADGCAGASVASGSRTLPPPHTSPT